MHLPYTIIPVPLKSNVQKTAANVRINPNGRIPAIVDRDAGEFEGGETPQMMSLGVHLRIIGRPGRAAAFERFLQDAQAKSGVWIATRLEIARRFARTHPYVAAR